MTRRTAALTMLVGGVLAAIGSLLPWAEFSTAVGVLPINGTEGDGTVTLFLGTALALVGAAAYDRLPHMITSAGMIVLGAIVVTVALVDYLTILDRLRNIDETSVRGVIGVGLYVTAVGGLVAAAGGFALLSTPKARRNALPRTSDDTRTA